MAVPSTREFLDRFPIFDEYEITEVQITIEINAASRRVNADAWGEQAGDAVLLLAAHNMVMKHRVQCCKLITGDDSTSYLAEYERMRESIISGDRVP